jgi:hypothetical protein
MLEAYHGIETGVELLPLVRWSTVVPIDAGIIN